MMNKDELLELVKLLSAIEGWGFTEQKRLPDYLLERLNECVEKLCEEIKK